MSTQDPIVLLQADDLVVNYGKARAVEGIGFTCQAGTTTALVGPNGAGKSSVLHALVGSLRGATGRVSVAGASLDGLGPNARAARGVTLVPQGRHVFKTLTVEENLTVIADSLRLDRDTIARGLERFPILRDRRRVLAGLLSGGEQQMLAIARALMSDPKVLLLDEPALGLAPGIVEQLMETVAHVATTGGAVVIAEPSTTTLRTEIDQGLIIQRGRVVATAEGPALAETYQRVLGISG